MVAARLLEGAVHALLHDHPSAVVGDDEAVQVKLEAVLHRGAVDLGDEAARIREGGAVEADPLARRFELLRGLPRPPQTWMPSSFSSGLRPRFSAPMTLVVMPEECQSMPITAPKDWNQNGCASRRSSSSRP